MKYLDLALSLIAPNHCLNCNKEGEVCCQNCLTQLKDKLADRTCYFCNNIFKNIKHNNINNNLVNTGICKKCFPKQNLDSVVWYTNYDNSTSSQLIKSLKFDNLYDSSNSITLALSDIISQNSSLTKNKKIIITSAPTAGKRSRSRGWDQARLMAKKIAQQNNLTHKSLLIRSSSFDQIGASKKQRAKASQNFFKAHRRALINNSIIILVDDVITTGSTLNSAARVLKQAGAKEVHGLVFARKGIK